MIVLADLAIFVMVFGGIVSVSDYTSSRNVFGKMLNQQELRDYFGKNWNLFNSLVGEDILVKGNGLVMDMAYITKCSGYFSRYYIRDVGQIPKWSPFTKMLDQRFKELLSERNTHEETPSGI